MLKKKQAKCKTFFKKEQNLKELLRKAHELPEVPGVYLMKNKEEVILYVGKSKNLKQRVTTYFQKGSQHSQKIQRLVKNIHHFEFIQVKSEFSALLLECQLIHRYRPPYNQQMNHYEAYGYFSFDEKNGLPKVSVTWQDQGICLGPYYKTSKMKDFLAIANSLYRLTGPLTFAQGYFFDFTKETTPLEKQLDLKKRLAEFQAVLQGNSQQMLRRLDDKVSFFSQRQDFSQAEIWWEKRQMAQAFLRRNRFLLLANQNQLFLGKLPLENGEISYFLYGKGEVLGEITYKRTPTDSQAFNRLTKKVPTSKWQELRVKPYLTKEDADLFPIFFNYLHRYGEVIGFPFPET